jgi:hypothetical protein
VTDSRVIELRSPRPVAAFRGSVLCRRTHCALILTGSAADSGRERLILTFITSSLADLPELPASLIDPAVLALDAGRYRISSGPRDWVFEATSVHLHRDIGDAFHRAVPSRPAPLKKRLFWRVVLALAHLSVGKRVLLAIRRK